MRYTIFDMEGNGLIDSITQIWVLCYEIYEDGKLIDSGKLSDYNDIIDFITEQEVLVCHNLIRFDIPALEKILDINITAKLIDTLALSWYLYPELNKHGLEAWGEYFGVPKPEIKDEEWRGPLEGETYEEFINKMKHRCSEDVKINSKLFFKQLEYLMQIYEGEQGVDSIIRYLSFKMDCAREQEEIKWKLDIQTCENNLEMFTRELNIKERRLSEVMPEKVKYRQLKKPAKMYKKDESLSKRGQDWLDILEEMEFPENYEGVIDIEVSREPGNPNSHVQLKDWLFDLGWRPRTFKFKKDKDTGKVDKIPQISLPFGQGVCPSVQELYEIEPELENIESLYVISHRIGILKGFLRDVDKYGYLKAEIAGLTNTLRFKHTTIVNLPGYTGKKDWKDGVYIRGCLIAPEGHVLCGSDMSSLEDRTKQHYMYYFDPEYVETMIKPGFDPHLDLAEFAYKMTNGEIGLSPEDVQFYKEFSDNEQHTDEDKAKFNRIKAERHSFKTVNYAAVYGSGAETMSRNSGMSIQRCQILLVAYWEKNWSVKQISKSCRVKTVQGQMWLFNPISKFWYSLRYEKDKFSTLNQGTGVFCFDNWVREARNRGLKMCGQFHDEIVTPVLNIPSKIQNTKDILKESIQVVNERLKLNRDLDVDVQFGDNYAEIH